MRRRKATVFFGHGEFRLVRDGVGKSTRLRFSLCGVFGRVPEKFGRVTDTAPTVFRVYEVRVGTVPEIGRSHSHARDGLNVEETRRVLMVSGEAPEGKGGLVACSMGRLLPRKG
jgi:hypothetical protein